MGARLLGGRGGWFGPSRVILFCCVVAFSHTFSVNFVWDGGWIDKYRRYLGCSLGRGKGSISFRYGLRRFVYSAQGTTLDHCGVRALPVAFFFFGWSVPRTNTCIIDHSILYSTITIRLPRVCSFFCVELCILDLTLARERSMSACVCLRTVSHWASGRWALLHGGACKIEGGLQSVVEGGKHGIVGTGTDKHQLISSIGICITTAVLSLHYCITLPITVSPSGPV